MTNLSKWLLYADQLVRVAVAVGVDAVAAFLDATALVADAARLRIQSIAAEGCGGRNNICCYKTTCQQTRRLTHYWLHIGCIR